MERIRGGVLRVFRSNTTSTRAVWFTMGALLMRGISIFTAPFFTRYLNPEQYGEFSLFSIWAVILAMVCSLYTHGAIPVAHARLEEKAWRPFLSSALTLSTLSFALFAALLLALRAPLGALMQVRPQHMPWLLCYGYAMYVTNAALGAYAQEKRHQRYFFLSLLLLITTTGLSVILVLRWTDRLQGRLQGMVWPTLAVALVLALRLWQQGRTGYSARHWRFALSVSLPLILQALFFVLLPQSNRILLAANLGTDAAGIFSLAYTFGAILEDIALSFNLSWMPAYFDHLRARRQDAAHAQGARLMRTITLLTLGFLLVCPEVFRLLVAPAYWSGIPMLTVLAMAAFLRFLSLFPLNDALYQKHILAPALASILALTVNIGCSLWLIPRYGGMGAAISTLVAYGMMLGILLAVMGRKRPLAHGIPFVPHALCVAAIGGFCLLADGLWPLRWALAAVCGGLLLRDLIRQRGFF